MEDLDIVGIRDAGDFDRERVVIKVNQVTQIGDFLFFYSRRTGDNSISSKVASPLWFPDISLNPKDLIVVYTKSGVSKLRTNDDGSQTYFLYWGQTKSVFVSENIPVLMKIRQWSAFFDA